jgi:hypothetical protein
MAEKQSNWDRNLVSRKSKVGIWEFKNGRMDMSKYKHVDGRMVEILSEGEDRCVEDSMNHGEYTEYHCEKHAQEQRSKYSEADRDKENRRLNEGNT